MSKTFKKRNKLSEEYENSLKKERKKIQKWKKYLVVLGDYISEIGEIEDDLSGKNWFW